jgi:MYXO-CTERM domain-containing protein
MHTDGRNGQTPCRLWALIAFLLFPATALAFPSTTMSWAYSGSQDGESLGTSVANVGDLNGDGYQDVAAGAPSYNDGSPNHGRVHVFYGSAAGLPAQPSWTAVGSVRDGLFGGSVAGAGDVNGDGYDDLIVGAQDHDGGSGDAGAVFLYYGSAGGLATDPAWTAFGEDNNDQFGCAVAGAGDVNGDGYDDVLVGSYRWMDTLVRQGKASLFLGGPGGPEVTPSWNVIGSDSGQNLGAALGGAGDVNGDGFDDVLIASPGYSSPQADEGKVMLFTGSAAGLAATPAWERQSDTQQAYFGTSVTGIGDVDADGYDDVIIGSRPNHFQNLQGSRVALYKGSADGLSEQPAWTALDELTLQDHITVGAAGDVNGDGLPDVLVGRESLVLTHHGDAWLFLSDGNTLQAQPAWSYSPAKDGMFYGSAVTAADVDNDGLSDLLIGARGYNGDYLNAGRIVLYLGSGEVSGDDDDTGDDDTGDDDAGDDDTWDENDSAPSGQNSGLDCSGCATSGTGASADAVLLSLLLLGAARLRRRRNPPTSAE